MLMRARALLKGLSPEHKADVWKVKVGHKGLKMPLDFAKRHDMLNVKVQSGGTIERLLKVPDRNGLPVEISTGLKDHRTPLGGFR